MRKIILPLILLSILLTAVPVQTQQTKDIKIAFFVIRTIDDMFFSLVVDFMKEACADLGMEMEPYYANGNHLLMVKQVEKVLNSQDKPEALVFINFKNVGHQIVKLAEKAKTPVFLINSALNPEEAMGGPREKYKYWIGEMLPDDVGAGYKLAQELITRAQPDKDGKIHMVAIEGERTTGASAARVQGLNLALEEHDNVILQQIVAGNWVKERAKFQFFLLRKRYPKTTVFWTASDGMAIGVAEGAKKLNLKLGVEVITGGVDWAVAGIEAVRQGEIEASLGGHVMEAGWAAVLLYDYFHDHDFATETVSMEDAMSAVTLDNIEDFTNTFTRENWHNIDFRYFSKTYNKSLQKYDFSMEAVMKQLTETPQHLKSLSGINPHNPTQ